MTPILVDVQKHEIHYGHMFFEMAGVPVAQENVTSVESVSQQTKAK